VLESISVGHLPERTNPIEPAIRKGFSTFSVVGQKCIKICCGGITYVSRKAPRYVLGAYHLR
jgi:hypothetical protein